MDRRNTVTISLWWKFVYVWLKGKRFLIYSSNCWLTHRLQDYPGTNTYGPLIKSYATWTVSISWSQLFCNNYKRYFSSRGTEDLSASTGQFINYVSRSVQKGAISPPSIQSVYSLKHLKVFKLSLSQVTNIEQSWLGPYTPTARLKRYAVLLPRALGPFKILTISEPALIKFKKSADKTFLLESATTVSEIGSWFISIY